MVVSGAAVVGLASCVGVLKHDPMTPDRFGAERALEAARRSSYIEDRERHRVATERRLAEMFGDTAGPLTSARPAEESWGLRGCLKSGQVFALTDIDIRDDSVCGKSGDATRCIPYSQMSAIGLPRDATVVGYFPVMQDLACEALDASSPPSDVR